MTVIDIHSHFFPATLPDFAARHGGEGWLRIERSGERTATIFQGERFFREITIECWDADARVAELDRQGLTAQVVCATPVLFNYHRESAAALEVVRHVNDSLLEFTNASRGRLLPLCQVPLQDIAAACAELTRCRRAGHLGVQIGNHVGPVNLDDAGVLEFLQHCARERAAVLVHPWDMMGRERMGQYMTMYTVGMPAETHLGIATAILGGVFDALPRDFRICFAHGGGSFPGLVGRLDQAWHHGPKGAGRGRCRAPPSSYLDRIYVDSIVYDDVGLRLLVERFGAERVLLGSDAPFDISEKDIGGLVRRSALAASVQDRILGLNAVDFLRLDGDGPDLSR